MQTTAASLQRLCGVQFPAQQTGSRHQQRPLHLPVRTFRQRQDHGLHRHRASFEDPVYIPYALYVYGQIIRLYDELNHQPMSNNGEGPKHDARWVLCRRPVVIVGGEMTEDALELRFNPILKYYDAPHQLRANNGVFIIDDFGRQKVSPRLLLHRWKYPLGTRQDFCCFHTGQQFAVPFVQLIILASNLNPHSMANDTIIEQRLSSYDAMGRLRLSRGYQRREGAEGTGELFGGVLCLYPRRPL